MALIFSLSIEKSTDATPEASDARTSKRSAFQTHFETRAEIFAVGATVSVSIDPRGPTVAAGIGAGSCASVCDAARTFDTTKRVTASVKHPTTKNRNAARHVEPRATSIF